MDGVSAYCDINREIRILCPVTVRLLHFLSSVSTYCAILRKDMESQEKKQTERNPSVSGGTFWEEQRPGVLMEIIGELVQHPFEVGHDVAPPRLEGMQHRHQHATGVGPSVRLRTE